jgi:hypothetical protein
MSEPRFTIQMTIRDRFGNIYHRAIGCDEALRISTRSVEELKSGLGLVGMEETISLMKTRELRRDVLVRTAEQLAHQLADTLADAEGWHDASRIEPAQKALGGEWK